MDPTYVDPPLGRAVTTQEMAEKVRNVAVSGRMDSPQAAWPSWFPQRPYPSSATYLREMEAYHKKRRRRSSPTSCRSYDALVIVGGSGAMVDLANNQRLHELILGFVQARQAGRRRVLRRRLPGVRPRLPREAEPDHRPPRHRPPASTTTTSTAPASRARTRSTAPTPASATAGSTSARRSTRWSSSSATRSAPKVPFIGNVGHKTSVLVDYPFITSRSTASSLECGRLLVEVARKRRAPPRLVTDRTSAVHRHQSEETSVTTRPPGPRPRSSSSSSPTGCATCSATPARSSRASSTRCASRPELHYILTLQESVAVLMADGYARAAAAAGARADSQLAGPRQRHRRDLPGVSRATRRWW